MRNLIFILCTFYLIPAFAIQDEEIRYYDIELIIYENQETGSESDSSEVWNKTASLLVPENIVHLGQPLGVKLAPEYNPLISFKLLSAEEMLLNKVLESLMGAEQYRVLLHTGWRQPGMPKDKALSVYFRHAVSKSSEPEITDVAFNPFKTTPEPEQATVSEEQTESGIIAPDANLQGIIQIVLSRYLHADIELVYQKAADESAIDRFDSDYLESRKGKDAVYYLKQNRRMRSKVLHYIDHPVLGVLVKITPFIIEQPTIPEATKPTNKGNR